jgi:hypothetical protein
VSGLRYGLEPVPEPLGFMRPPKLRLRRLRGQGVNPRAIRCRSGRRSNAPTVSVPPTACGISGTHGSLRRPCPMISMPTCRPSVPRPPVPGSTRRSIAAVSAVPRSIRPIPAALIWASHGMRRRSCISAARLSQSRRWLVSWRRWLLAAHRPRSAQPAPVARRR